MDILMEMRKTVAEFYAAENVELYRPEGGDRIDALERFSYYGDDKKRLLESMMFKLLNILMEK